MCNSSVHWLKVVVGGQRSLFENQWAEPIKRSLYLKGSFPKALSSFSAEIYVRKMPAGQRWTFASMWNIFRGSFEAATWFRQNIDERLPRVIQDKPKIFGYWNERPDDNSNIFLRSARYTIFRGRKSGTIYTLKAFKSTLIDELSCKNKGIRYIG